MANNRTTRRSAPRSEKTRDARSVKKFLEELSWVLNSYSNLDFRAIPEVISGTNASSLRRGSEFQQYVSKNPNIHFLVGALPVIFSDERLFPSNEDIAEFASDALALPISRWEKRSRYELIGLIACETAKLDDEGLARLVQALARLTSDEARVRNVFKERKDKKMSWNEMIQRLTHGNGND